MSMKINLLKEMSTNITVMYVEDDDKLRANTTELLKKIFDNVYTYTNGEDGYAGFVEHNIDLIITDLKMPRLNGLNMTKRIREVDKDVKIIFMTAFDDKQILINSIALNISLFLTKPVDLESFIDGIYPIVEEIKKHKDKEALGEVSLDAIHAMINSQTNPVCLLSKRKIEYCNKPFLKMFGIEGLDEFKENFGTIDSIIKTKEMHYDTIKHHWVGESVEHEFPFTLEINSKVGNTGLYLINTNTKLAPENQILLTFMDMQSLSLTKERKQDFLNQDDFEEIFGVFKSLYISKLPFTIFNTFKGLPIEHQITVASIDGDTIIAHLDPKHLSTINYEKNTLLIHSSFQKTVRADLIAKDGNKVTLGNFRYTDYNPKEDNILSLELERSSVVEVKTTTQKFLANLFKISIRHIFINECDKKLESGENIVLHFELEYRGVKKTLNLHGEVVVQEDDIVEIDVFPNDTSEKIIAEYVSKRQLGLIREFKNRLH